MTRHVLECREHAIFGERQRRALKSTHGGHAQRAHEIRIFAIGFFDATPARIACNVHDRREHQLRTARANLTTDDGEDALEQLRIPTAG